MDPGDELDTYRTEDGGNSPEVVDAGGAGGSPFRLVLLGWMDWGRVVDVVGPVSFERTDQRTMVLEEEVTRHLTR